MATAAATYDVFTPPEVASKMRSYLPPFVERLLEPSVGTGSLLRVMDGCYTHADVYDINTTYLDQVPDTPSINKNCTNFLTAAISTTYDAILMNPPYLRYQEMSDELRSQVRGLSDILRKGNVDLYVAFLVKCIQLLSPTGTLVAIVPSTWRYNKSAAGFRDWLTTNRLIHAIHDYGSKKIFKGVNVYCCILVVTKSSKHTYLLNDTPILYEEVHTEAPTQQLGDICDITNGVATLCDSAFIHDTPLFDEPCWKPILKVSLQITRSIIYPYDTDGKIIPEDRFKADNPQTYAYLDQHRAALANRDRGHKQYETWYAFGRKQGLKIPTSTQSVYVSTLCAPSLPTSVAPTTLFYSGIRITPNDPSLTCEDVQAIIAAQRDRIANACSKRSNDWINVTSTSLRGLPVSR